jgi:hypothetical protein
MHLIVAPTDGDGIRANHEPILTLSVDRTSKDTASRSGAVSRWGRSERPLTRDRRPAHSL